MVSFADNGEGKSSGIGCVQAFPDLQGENDERDLMPQNSEPSSKIAELTNVERELVNQVQRITKSLSKSKSMTNLRKDKAHVKERSKSMDTKSTSPSPIDSKPRTKDDSNLVDAAFVTEV